jgi:plasmid stabilization system protein ParE
VRKHVQLHPAALAEAEAALRWYLERSQRAAESFLREISRAVDQIAQTPDRFPQFEFGTRKILLRRFPYWLVFRETATAVEIVALAHGRRKPGYWRDRVQ